MSPEATFLDTYQERRAQQARARVIAADEAEWGPRKIVASQVQWFVPVTGMDWCAHFDGDEETGRRGWGNTEREAIADLLDTYGDDA